MSVYGDRRARLLQEMARRGARRAPALRQRLAERLSALRHRFRHPRRPGARHRAARTASRSISTARSRPTAPRSNAPASRSCMRLICSAASTRRSTGFSNRRIGTAPARLIPRKIAARAKDLNLGDRTAFLDRLLMGKLPSEIDAIRRACKVADEGYAVFRDAARPGRADYELIAEAEAFFRSKGVDDNFQIIGVGGPEVRGMAPPSGKKLKRRRHGDDRADALRRRLLRADLPHAGGRRAQCRAEEGLRALSRGHGGRHRCGARRRHRRRHRARRERNLPPRRARRSTSPINTPACAATASGCSPTPSRISSKT